MYTPLRFEGKRSWICCSSTSSKVLSKARQDRKKASITACLDALEDKDLIYREVCKSDRRKNFIRLSEKTMKFARMMVEREKEYNAQIIAGIPEEELEVFFKVTDRILKNIMEEEDEADI